MRNEEAESYGNPILQIEGYEQVVKIGSYHEEVVATAMMRFLMDFGWFQLLIVDERLF